MTRRNTAREKASTDNKQQPGAQGLLLTPPRRSPMLRKTGYELSSQQKLFRRKTMKSIKTVWLGLALLAGASCIGAGLHQAAAIELAPPAETAVIYANQPAQQPAAPVRTAYAERSNMGGGFIEFLFGNGVEQPQYRSREPKPERAYANTAPAADPRFEYQRPGFEMDPRYERQEVDYRGTEAPGTIVIDTPNKFLYLVEGGGRAMRYGVGVGRPGFTWAGVHAISAKKEWPDWVPPPPAGSPRKAPRCSRCRPTCRAASR